MPVEARFLSSISWTKDPLQSVLIGRARYRELRQRTSNALALAVRHQNPLLAEHPVTTAIRVSSRDFNTLDRSTIEHQSRSAELAGGIGARLNLSGRQLRILTTAAMLHDVGKLFVPVGLLQRPGPLTTEEYKVVQDHAALGESWLAEQEVPQPIPAIVRSHHERWDGQGYPDRLRGKDIPLSSRILGLADAMDAMLSQRPYHCGRTMDEVRVILKRESGRAFDPSVVEAVFSFWD